jgi:hypothetical protein
MEFGDAVAELFVLLVIGALVAGVLLWLKRVWAECRTDTEYAQVRVSWPTTTVKATLFDASLRHFERSAPGIIGHYRFEFDGREHTAEVYECSAGPREERAASVQALREESKTIDLEVQFDPRDPSVVSNDIVRHVPKCRYWIGGTLLFFCVMALLVLRGLLILILGIIRG